MFSHPNPEAYASDASHIRVFVGERDASCLTLYSFSSVYSFLCAEKSNNVGISTFLLTLLHLSLSLAGQVPSKILLNRWNHWDFCAFFKLMRVKKCTRPCRSPRFRRSERRSYERETKVRFGPGAFRPRRA